MLWHIVMKRREQNADVMSVSMDDRRNQNGDAGLEVYTMFCEWCGWYCVVSLLVVNCGKTG